VVLTVTQAPRVQEPSPTRGLLALGISKRTRRNHDAITGRVGQNLQPWRLRPTRRTCRKQGLEEEDDEDEEEKHVMVVIRASSRTVAEPRLLDLVLDPDACTRAWAPAWTRHNEQESIGASLAMADLAEAGGWACQGALWTPRARARARLRRLLLHHPRAGRESRE
jgi:hypothetical protein